MALFFVNIHAPWLVIFMPGWRTNAVHELFCEYARSFNFQFHVGVKNEKWFMDVFGEQAADWYDGRGYPMV
ncbi:hypothetical protein BRO54_1604 [Geobacillus proteiniphilus]|uniref:Uncharacterized protein n=1 Tax=Geobacillus proteiniphilus TaxID=860353 RepID=A0A1Q5T1Y1_9BACL|nr:hypothetical protein BRO54_1604 [Geobacillus proteiniphilus]